MSDRRLNINVIMGGPSAEHEVSLVSGREVLRHLDRTLYTPTALVVTHDRKFYRAGPEAGVPSPEDLADPHDSALFAGPISPSDSRALWEACDAAFLALHGSFGEDGVIQGYLDTLGIPYTGSGVHSSALCMNKITTKQVYASCGLETPSYALFGPGNPDVTVESIVAQQGLPCFVKCPQSGSSRLMGRAATADELKGLLDQFSTESRTILVEMAVSGEEYSCPVLERPDGSVEALPAVLIRPLHSNFFDYEAKYTDGASEEVVPAPCTESLSVCIRQAALQAHHALGCEGLSRTDIIVSNDRPYLLETNTLPGLTPQSLAPKAFAAAGGTYAGLLDILIQDALPRGLRRKQ